MKPKNQRLVLVAAAIVALLAAVLLAMWGLKDRASYFYTPADIAAGKAAPGQAVRLGGMVEKGSVQREGDGVTIRFVVTDGKAATPVRYRGIVPDLFREGSGAVAEGRMRAARSSPTPSSPSMTSATCRPSSAILRRSTRPGRRSRNDRRDRPCGAVARGGARGVPVPADDPRAARRRSTSHGRCARSRSCRAALTLLAFAMLLLVFARSDMSVALVFENSHSAKPFIYKVAGAWGNHEGSMLMWVTILAVAGAFVALFSRRTSERTLVAGARQPGRAGARLLCLPADRFEPVRAAQSRAAGRAGAQPAAAGPRPRLPPADALPRLCRAVGRVQPRGRRAADRRGRQRGWRARCGRGCSARGSC